MDNQEDNIIKIPHDIEWYEAELNINSAENDFILSIAAVDSDLNLHLIGSAFIISSYGTHALAISAAHCFEQVKKVIDPHVRHNLSTPREFLPRADAVDIKSAHALYITKGSAYSCNIKIAYWDSESDFALLEITAPEGKKDLFDITLFLDNELPKVGDHVAMIGVGEMKVNNSGENGEFTLQRRLVGRVGRVEEVNMERSFLLKSPHIVTSIAICSGMSGGLVARLSNIGENIKPFALISHAPEPQPYLDPKTSGHSVAAILPIEVKINRDGTRDIKMNFNCVEIGTKDKG